MQGAIFPRPVKLGAGATRWPLSKLIEYESRQRGTEPPEISPAQERYLTASETAARLGVGVGTIWRWSARAAAAA